MSFWRFWKSKPKEIYYPGYSESFVEPFAKHTSIDELRLVALDTETTGLNSNKDRILSIAAVAIKGGGICIEDRFEAYILQSDFANTSAIAIHEITPAETKIKGESEAEVITDFALWLKNAVIVGHHIRFDFDILSNAMKRHHGLSLKNKTLDTARLAIRLMEPIHEQASVNPSKYSLKSLASSLDIDSISRHTAAGDALTTALVLIHLLHLAKKRGITTAGDLLKT